MKRNVSDKRPLNEVEWAEEGDKLDANGPHDLVAHSGLAARQTGFREGCKRCDYLRSYKHPDERAAESRARLGGE